ncbi:MAG: hypothetical protein ABIR11_02960 [Candidatus Limnocylindrales bacterium]
MRGCLFTLLLGAVALVLIVVVGLPQVAAGLLTTAVGAAGLQADDTTVTVSSDPPTDLVGLHADRVRIRATSATFRGLAIGALDVELHDVSLIDRSARGIDGRMTDVIVPNVGGRSLRLDAITLGGGGETVTAATLVAGTDAERLIADAIETKTGVRPKVSLGAPDRLVVDVGVSLEGTLDVNAAGDLVVVIADNPVVTGDIVLLRAGEDLPIRLTGVGVMPGGDLQLTGELAIGILR